MAEEDRRTRARRRALRAAQVVTISLALVGVTGCTTGERMTGIDSGGAMMTTDSGSMMGSDSGSMGTDSGSSGDDAGTTMGDDGGPGLDAGAGTDAGTMMADAGSPPADAGPGCDAAATMGAGDCYCPDPGMAGSDPDCCVAAGGIWVGGGCAVPGPFVPPSAAV